MSRMLSRRQLTQAIGCSLLLIVAVASATQASGVLPIANPNSALGEPNQPVPLYIGFFRPDDPAGFIPLNITSPISHSDGRRVAYLGVAPVGTTAVEAKFYAAQSIPQDAVALVSTAQLRYQIGGREVYVVTAEPSVKAQERSLVLGQARVELPGGRVGYTSTNWQRKDGDKSYRGEYNGVTFAEDGLIIWICGDLPAAQLTQLAATIVVSR